MRLYAGMSKDFIDDTVRNQIADKLSSAFFTYYRYRPSPQEINSWRNSLRAMSQILDRAHLHDHGILLEYQLPLSSKRLDCMVCGQDASQSDNAVIVELKQWDKCESSEAEKLVSTWVGGRKRDVLHPAVQVGQYRQYLEDTHSAFYEGDSPVNLGACSYLHNYWRSKDDPLFDKKFAEVIEIDPVFDADGAMELCDHLAQRLQGGAGRQVLDRIELSKYRPSRKLMDHVSDAIKSKSPWILLDEQLVVFEKILASVRSAMFGRRKQVIIVHGGPGTGKSVLAINLLADLMRAGINAHYATGSKAFTETLWKKIGNRSKASVKYFNSYGAAEVNDVDVLICDESHRIRETSSNRFTKKELRSTTPQVEELLKAAKVAVFFIDDRQVVRPNEIGSTAHIREFAAKLEAEIEEYELEIQFRCAGSDGFVNWIDNTLGIERTANILWDGSDGFDFRIVDSPDAVEREIRKKVAEGNSGRVAAGFCWPWSVPKPDGTLEEDVVVGDYKRPWDAKPGNWKLAPGIPSASLWATDPNGINQIGCVYNIQGFELDYIGVIWGPDLRYDLDAQDWIGDKKASADQVVKRSKEKFVDLVKNTYRVLLSRGMKGCYVHFMDKDTERFVRSRIEKQAKADPPIRDAASTLEIISLDDVRVEQERYKTLLPLYSLKAAAGYFGNGEIVEPEGWVEARSVGRLDKTMFIARAVGRSMEPQIRNGDLCVFRSDPIGSRNGKIVLAQFRGMDDPETGGAYTVKKYQSSKTDDADSEWRHSEIRLLPINPAYHPIIVNPKSEGDFRVLAELLGVIGN